MKKLLKRILGIILFVSVVVGGLPVSAFAAGSVIHTDSFVYGYSVNGRELVCYSISPEVYDKTILLEFELHGFEDYYDHDGQALVTAAYDLISHYAYVDDMNRTRLLIVPSANPDGLYDGYTNYGFGRCNADGIDLNRDFDANYVSSSSARNYTPYAFSGKESRALRDLYYEYEPDIVIDFHGWENSLVGDTELKTPFREELGNLTIRSTFGSSNATGYFSNWAHQQGSLAMLVEFPSPSGIDMDNLENAIDRLIFDDFDNSKIDYTTQYLYGDSGDSGNSGDSGSAEVTTVFSDKSIVVMAASTIALGSGDYIDEKEICIVRDVDIDTGYCTVTYSSNGNNVFTSGSVNQTAELALSDLTDCTFDPDISLKTISEDAVVYPTSALNAYNTSWGLDAGGEYYLLADQGSKRCIMYYCDGGGHAGYWKIGWIGSAGNSGDSGQTDTPNSSGAQRNNITLADGMNAVTDSVKANSVYYLGTKLDLSSDDIQSKTDMVQWNSDNSLTLYAADYGSSGTNNYFAELPVYVTSSALSGHKFVLSANVSAMDRVDSHRYIGLTYGGDTSTGAKHIRTGADVSEYSGNTEVIKWTGADGYEYYGSIGMGKSINYMDDNTHSFTMELYADNTVKYYWDGALVGSTDAYSTEGYVGFFANSTNVTFSDIQFGYVELASASLNGITDDVKGNCVYYLGTELNLTYDKIQNKSDMVKWSSNNSLTLNAAANGSSVTNNYFVELPVYVTSSELSGGKFVLSANISATDRVDSHRYIGLTYGGDTSTGADHVRTGADVSEYSGNTEVIKWTGADGYEYYGSIGMGKSIDYMDGNTHSFKLELYADNTVKYFWDGMLVGSTDAYSTEGYVGFFANSTDVRFSDIQYGYVK